MHNLASLLNTLESKLDEPNERPLTLGATLDVIGRRAYGPLLLLVGLVSVSPATLMPGSTWAMALLTLVIALQLALMKRFPWMPRAVLDLKIPKEPMRHFIEMVRPSTRVIDAVMRPRLQFLAEPPWTILVALLCISAALVTFPLGLIPMGPIAPGLAISFFGLGMTARDGVALTLGALILLIAIYLATSQLL